VTIDGIPVNSNTFLADKIGRMRGRRRTSVKIGIMREGHPEPIVFTLMKRSRVELHSVREEMLRVRLRRAMCEFLSSEKPPAMTLETRN